MANVETFRWRNFQLDVTALLRDIAECRVAVRGIRIDRQEIEAHALTVLRLPGVTEVKEWQFPIDWEYVRSLASERCKQPLLLVYFGDSGFIAVEDESPEPCYVLADGNHRLARAYVDGRQRVVVHIVARKDAERYWSGL